MTYKAAKAKAPKFLPLPELPPMSLPDLKKELEAKKELTLTLTLALSPNPSPKP